jgi:UPF0716 protein FxsA
MILPGVVVLIAAEVAALVLVAQQIGVLATILLLLAGSLVGGWLLRREGLRAWRAFGLALVEGRPPGREVLDGMLVLLGGALVVFPGFVSDALGLLCLLPPTRRGLAGLLRRYATRRAQVQVVRVRASRGPATGPTDGGTGPVSGGAIPPDAGAGRVIEGEIEP